MKILYRYILREHAGPFLFAFATILFVFTLHFLTIFIDRFVGKGLDFFVMVELIVLQIAWMVVLAAPMAVLVATLIAFGNLTNRSEMAVMRAGGLSLYRLILPVLLASVVLTVLVERFNNVVLPEANYQAKLLLRDITRAKPSFGLQENAFSGLVEGYSILVRKTEWRSDRLEGITIYEGVPDDYKSVITAESGRIEFTPDYHYLIMTLENGEMHELQEESREEYRVTSFEKQRFVFASTGYGFERTSGDEIRRGDRELSASSLRSMAMKFRKRMGDSEEALQALLSAKKTSGGAVSGTTANAPAGRAEEEARIDRQIERERKQIESSRKMYNRYMVEFHKKYALSFACIVFVLVGAPLGVMARRGGFGVGAGLSLLFFVLYWALLILGEKISDRGLLDPGLSMWLANIVMTAIGVFFLLKVSGGLGGSGR